MSNQRFPEEFKIEAVRQVTERGLPVAEVAARLGACLHTACMRGSSATASQKPSVIKRMISRPSCVVCAPNSNASLKSETS